MKLYTHLPKLYRKVYGQFDYCHDYLAGGEHQQEVGYNYFPVCRVACKESGWKWLLLDKDFTPDDALDCYSNGMSQDIDMIWSTTYPKWEEDYTEQQLIEIKIDNARKYTHNTTIKQRKLDAENDTPSWLLRLGGK